MGSFMMLAGRSLTAARIASIALSSLAAPLPYLALRAPGVDVPRVRAVVATAFALLTPWMLWSGATTVPESFTATASASAIIVLASRRSAPSAPSAPFAALLACACLSRYEAWPVAAVAALCLLTRDRSRRSIVVALACAAAPLAWMLWNAHAHGSPLHFFHRVSSFKRAIGAGSTSTLDALLFYPRLLLDTRAEVVAAFVVGLYALRDPALAKRWRVPLLAAVAQVAFLAIGNARDGAPAHHPERALLGVFIILALFAIDACLSLAPRPRTITLAIAAASWLVTSRAFAHPPGRSPAEDRSAQIARGLDLRARAVAHVTVTPCAYEHFALVAAYGAPENATIVPKSDAPVGVDCPNVETR